MSPSSEAEDLLGMAHEEPEQVRVMDGAGVVQRKLWSSLYYAMFYAAKAALLALGYEPRSHRGVNVLVGKVLFHERGLIERPSASFFSEMRRLREELDYTPHAVLPERDVADAYVPTRSSRRWRTSWVAGIRTTPSGSGPSGTRDRTEAD